MPAPPSVEPPDDASGMAPNVSRCGAKPVREWLEYANESGMYPISSVLAAVSSIVIGVRAKQIGSTTSTSASSRSRAAIPAAGSVSAAPLAAGGDPDVAQSVKNEHSASIGASGSATTPVADPSAITSSHVDGTGAPIASSRSGRQAAAG